MSQGLLIIEDSRSHSDTLRSVGLLWTSDQSDAENSDNTQHSQQTDIHAAGGIRTRKPSKRVAADSRRIPRGHWDRHIHLCKHISVSGRTYIISLSPSVNFSIFFLFHFTCSGFMSHLIPLPKCAIRRLVKANASSPVCKGCPSA